MAEGGVRLREKLKPPAVGKFEPTIPRWLAQGMVAMEPLGPSKSAPPVG